MIGRRYRYDQFERENRKWLVNATRYKQIIKEQDDTKVEEYVKIVCLNIDSEKCRACILMDHIN